MSENQEFSSPPQLQSRPQALTALCVLSFIWSGMNAVSCLFLYVFHAEVLGAVESGIYKEMGLDMAIIQNIARSYFLWTGILQIFSFFGISQLWKMKKTGFHFYAISQLLMLIVSSYYIYRPSGVFPVLDLLITGSFVLIYFRYFKKME